MLTPYIDLFLLELIAKSVSLMINQSTDWVKPVHVESWCTFFLSRIAYVNYFFVPGTRANLSDKLKGVVSTMILIDEFLLKVTRILLM